MLDVGCGSGHVTAALAHAGHTVVGVDPDPEMVDLAASRTAAEIRPGGLPDLPTSPRSFDAVVANFVINHVDDPRAGARGLAAAARPGGLVVATIWPAYVPEHVTLWNALLDECGATRPEIPGLAPGLDFERSPEGLGLVLSEAGLDVFDAATTAWEWRVRPEAFWAGATRLGNLGLAWRAQPAEVHERMRQAFWDIARPWLDGDHLVLPARAVVVHAST